MHVSAISRLRSVSFRVARRGYERTEVDRYLTSLAAELERLEVQLRVDQELRTGGSSSDRAETAAPDPGSRAEAETEAERIVAEARERAAAVAAEVEETRSRVLARADALRAEAERDAARIREQAELDAERVRAAALTGVHELVELGKHRAIDELEQAFAELDAAGAVQRREPGRRFDREAYERRLAEAAERPGEQVA